MARNPARRHQHCVEADIADAIVWIMREPHLGGADDARALALGHRPGGIIERLTRLDLDEHQEMPPPRDDVDLAERTAPAPRQDAKAFGDEKRRCSALGRNAGAKRDHALRARRWHRRRAWGAWSVIIGHGRGPWRAPARVDKPRAAAGRSPRRSRRRPLSPTGARAQGG